MNILIRLYYALGYKTRKRNLPTLFV